MRIHHPHEHSQIDSVFMCQVIDGKEQRLFWKLLRNYIFLLALSYFDCRDIREIKLFAKRNRRKKSSFIFT